ncbi:phosphoenolpyruvate carboxykinase [Phytophthora infestans T30-4]|uniref:phosphoenolpyruvate carboxykinase (ATP) n=1 Tax=Phytophthora infestans (strain T30-4) TaxID=403677 RepID=D0NEL2_PHYIT|nr:phosphoenolpyruvate carboxykinase [Phytophthora infestans T30-4]EEY56657.1 phosphoenolpyruvate carboxykinase [Phytophthora infestans T30-4]|eukprot:XP_002902731.1 phosphoenolpyruvate carboxykinase [Phytophthora infestans T30-4]
MFTSALRASLRVQRLGAMKMAQSSPAFSSSFGLRTFANATAASLGIDKFGVTNAKTQVHRNLSYDEIAVHEEKNGEGHFVKNGTYTIDTGKFTGRSPKDKFIVDQAPSSKNIWWGDINQPVSPEVFDELYETVSEHYGQAEKVYVFDGYAGANPASRKKVRFITELAWQHHFVTNMFLRPQTKEEIADFKPDFTIVNACKVTNKNYKKHGLNSEVFVAFNIEKDVAVIGGTWYGGEMKKGIFSMMNYWLPLDGIMAMHCSANKGKNGDTALFFGLSGTGKTTLSADPHRYLIGDDEHGWDDEGIFNFEGGCYAKTINLSAENEPDIYNAIKRDALLENTYVDAETKEPDFYNTSKTENGRVSYPIYHIPNHEPTSSGGHPNNIVFLTCDAYGVLPPVSKLSDGQAMYHFLSGYTAKVAGTERGVTEPTATFSACFGAAFLPLHPTKYADLLQKKLQKHNTSVYLVNTGWTSGGYGVGKRMSIKDTRACIDAILDGSIKNSEFLEDPNFGFSVPKKLGEIPENVLNPREAWSDKEAYDVTAKKLAGMFQENFKKYVSPGVTDYSKFGPKL